MSQHHTAVVTMKLPIQLKLTSLISIHIMPFLIKALTLLNLALIIAITCLDLTAFITRSTPVPALSGHLVDNGKVVCSVNLALTFGPRLPWNCIDGFHAYSTQEGRQLVYTRDNFIRAGESRQFILTGVRSKVQQNPYGGNQHTVIKGMWFGCKLSDNFEGYGKRTFEAHGKKVFEIDYKGATLHERRMKGRVYRGGEVVDERGQMVTA